MKDFSVIWRVRLDAQTLVLLLLLELNSPCFSHRQLLLDWQRLIPPSANRKRWMGKMGYQFRSIDTLRIPEGSSQLSSMSSRSDSSYPLVSVSYAPTLESTFSLISNVPCWLGVMGTRGQWLSNYSCLGDSNKDQTASGISRQLFVKFLM